ncbi:MAG TPA: cyclic nucleotide-binding domain-containing protein [Pseudolabrys sp.]|nr:cyclic nucleotide-binding domain-containing protein [Pseudolabrys sp.]
MDAHEFGHPTVWLLLHREQSQARKGAETLGARPMSDDVVGFSFLAESDIPVWYLKAGETIFKEGETAKELYVIKSGQVEIQLGNRLLATLETNDIFGEMALIDSAPRSATAVAKTDVALVPVSKKDFVSLVSRAPTFALDIMGMLARRLRDANKAI